MTVTIFNASRTSSKYPKSPYGNNTFEFESFEVDDISDVFSYLTSNFTLNIPLSKNIKSRRKKDQLKKYFCTKLDYIILDIDDLDTLSDREICLKYFRDNKWECILGESRTDYRIKGVLKVDKVTQKEGKLMLKELDLILPGKMDISSLNFASYQAPILKSNVLYQGGNRLYPTPPTPQVATVEALEALKARQPVAGVEQLCQEQFHQMGFSFDTPNNGGTGYTCSHPSEVKSKGGFTWNSDFPFLMMHWNQSRNVSVWEQVIGTDKYKKLQKDQSKESVKEVLGPESADLALDDLSINKGKVINVNERYLKNHGDIVNSLIVNNNDCEKLIVESPMGTAKSNIISETIFQARKNNMKILFITSRVSLADDICSKYDGIKHYQGTKLEDTNYTIGDDLAVQIDSLYKFSIKFFDVVVIDEYTTTLTQLFSMDKNEKTDIAVTKFLALQKKKLIILDAFIIDEMDVFKTDKYIKLKNNYKDDINIEIFDQKENFIQTLLDESKLEPVTFSSGSTQIIKIIENMAQGEGLKTLSITSETPQNLKKLIVNGFKNPELSANILMFSPSITVGVSIESDVNSHYHFDSGLSMDIFSSIQMTKRTRKAKNLKLFLSERLRYDIVDLEILREKSPYIEMDSDGDSLGLTNVGETFIRVERAINILENRHKVSFLCLLNKQYIISEEKVKKNETKILNFLTEERKIVKTKSEDKFRKYTRLFLKMSIEELSEIISKPYITSNFEKTVRGLYKVQTDETLNLSLVEFKDIIGDDLDDTFCNWEFVKKNITDTSYVKNSILTSKGYTLTKDKIKSKKLYGSKEYGFKNTKHLKTISNKLTNIIKGRIDD